MRATRSSSEALGSSAADAAPVGSSVGDTDAGRDRSPLSKCACFRSLPSLESVLEHYASGGSGHVNQDERIQPRSLSAQDRSDLMAFLESLTDDEFVTWSEGLRP